MVIVCEDKGTSTLPAIFTYGYDKVHFCESITQVQNQLNIIENLYENEIILVFMDLAPGNQVISRKFKSLRNRRSISSNKVIILPIVCLEYYLLKNIHHLGAFDEEGITTILDINKLLSKKPEKYFKSTLENSCKHYLTTFTYPCWRNKDNPKVYPDRSCDMLTKLSCIKKYNTVCPSLIDKQTMLYDAMEYHPSKDIHSYLSYNTIINLANLFIVKYNNSLIAAHGPVGKQWRIQQYVPAESDFIVPVSSNLVTITKSNQVISNSFEITNLFSDTNK